MPDNDLTHIQQISELYTHNPNFIFHVTDYFLPFLATQFANYAINIAAWFTCFSASDYSAKEYFGTYVL